MIWVLVIVLALVCLALLVFVLKVPRGTWEAVACALLLGIAGYALQGSPGMSGAPKEAAESVSGRSESALIEARSKVSDKGIPTSNRWVVIADGLARNGRYADAAEVLRGAVENDPKNSDAWLAMANALLAHTDGALTAPTLYAYRRAASADPGAPGPPFFLGLAFIQSGRLAEARDLWAGVVANAPKDAPWKPLLARQLAALEAVIAAQSGQSARSADGNASEPAATRP